MEPIEAGPFTFYPLGITVALLLILFYISVAFIMKKRGLKPGTASWFAVLSIPLCFATARLGFCLTQLDLLVETEDWGMFFRTGEGGFLLWGAIGGLLIAAALTGKLTAQGTGKIADSVIVPTCLMIAAIRVVCGLMFAEQEMGFSIAKWFDPEETDYACRYSLWMLEDYSFFERLPFAVENYYGVWCWAIFVPEALWACFMAWITGRNKSKNGGRTALFIILYACGQILWEGMRRGRVIYLPWQGFVKVNQILCAFALVAVICVCLKRLQKEVRGKAALICFVQVILAMGIVVAMEFAAFEKKITLIETWPADVCHVIEGLACLWMGLAVHRLWKKAYALHAGNTLVES